MTGGLPQRSLLAPKAPASQLRPTPGGEPLSDTKPTETDSNERRGQGGSRKKPGQTASS